MEGSKISSFLSSCFGFCVLGCWSRYEGADCYLCITSFLAIVGLGGWDKNQGSRDAPTGRVVIGSYVELRYFSLQPLCLWVDHLEILLYRCLIYQSCCLRKQKVQKLPTYHFFSILFTKNSFHPVKGKSVCCIKWGLYIDEALFGGNWGMQPQRDGALLMIYNKG